MNVVVGEQAVERGPADAEDLRATRQVVVAGGQGALDRLDLSLAPRLAQRDETIALRLFGEAQVRGRDPIFARQNHRALDPVLELAHVSGPWIVADGRERRLRKVDRALLIGIGIAL